MAYIFLDESGDLGFNFKKKKTSRYFIVTCVLTNNKRELEQIVRKIFKGFSQDERQKHTGVLHAYKEQPKTVKKLLDLMNKDSAADIFVAVIDKKKVSFDLQGKKHRLYNHATAMLIDCLYRKKAISSGSKINLVASRRDTSRFLNLDFSTYLAKWAKTNHSLDIEIIIAPPEKEKALQITDVISWSIFRKYEYKDTSYYNLIKNHVQEELHLFPINSKTPDAL